MAKTFEHEPIRGRSGPQRPSFSSMKTSDRLRECEQRPASVSKIRPHRRSIFKEEGLEDMNSSIHPSHPASKLHRNTEDNTITKDTNISTESKELARKEDTNYSHGGGDTAWYSKLIKGSRPQMRGTSSAPPSSFSTFPRAALIAFLIAVVVPGLRYSTGSADAGVIERRANPTDICTRWAHQSALVNSTIYIFGGQAKTAPSQTTDTLMYCSGVSEISQTYRNVLTWSDNNLLRLDLDKSWKITSPALTALAQPSGPPAVAQGALWNSYKSLFVYGGYFSQYPPVSPPPLSIWEYSIVDDRWTEQKDPKTSAGNHSEGDNQPVQRAAEGAGLSVPEIGRSWYFGGHLDEWTTPGWSNQIFRVYLKSFLEFTHPGYSNSGVSSLGSTKAAGSDGVYRNITQGGLQEAAGFTERADGVIVYIPGWGTEGIILGLAGGTNTTFTEMNVIDVFDVANSEWYKQSTSGESPPIRVNPCATVVMAPDGSSVNVYLYGGQNLIPFGEQIQYDDVWILSIPSFTWLKVDTTGQSNPPARAGHTCAMWDGQMVVIGGYVGKDISCDSPGIYVFNASSLKWSNEFTALSSSSNSHASSDSSIIQGSFGYQVPDIVQSVVGGGPQGGATVTQPAAGSATAGPIATGKPPTFTVTQSGSTVTQTSAPVGSSQSTPAKSGPNVAAIAAGVVAAALAILAAYLAFCTWLYRKQLNQYKNHVAMSQRREPSPVPGGRLNEKVAGAGVFVGPFGTDLSTGRPSVGESSHSSVPAGSIAAGSVVTPSFTPSSGVTPGSGGSVPTPSTYAGGYGGGSMPGGGIAGKGYSEEDEGNEYHGRPSGSTANSSTEDLLSGQEPSFFNVVLNPRRTLRVVNSD
ncbi:hypothetical protein HYFRA_00008866 [Hymenoscyphus fraxineus]|uniref:Kelch repeat-containing protein n=1 Tax=Hymenoscyphus fraxineus TaxID=746836 RepID=A0A9N9L1J8_9HELO|nr:hypothetical protein HYFRA_00008866 [Hymenoscyphus fraxineus]